MNFSYFNCPKCGCQLLDTNNVDIKEEYQTPKSHEYFCFNCQLEIMINELEEEE